MRPKYKVTGCARFFVFLVIFVPAVFFGAAYFRGENGMQIIKDFFSGITGGKDEAKEKAKAEDGEKAEEKAKAEDGEKAEEKAKAEETYIIDDLKDELKKAEEEIKTLKEEIEAKDKEIEILKAKAEAKAKE